MKVEDNHYKYRIETKDSNGSVIDFVDIDTVEPLRCAYDVQDELNLETNEHIKRVEEIILNADSTEFWYVDEDRSTDTHLVCYFEEVQLMANADHPMVDTDRSLFEYGKINANEHQDTNFICTHVMPNGVSRIYMSIDKDQLLYQVFTNETIKEYIAQNPVTIWYAIRYPVSIPRSMSKGHLLTLDGQTDVSISTNGKEVGLPLVKFNIGETEYNVDNKALSIKNTTEGAQIRNIVLEGNTPINYARGNGVNTTEATSDTRYDFDPFYDGQTTIQGTVEGGYVSAKLYGDTMVNIAKPYGETPLLTATSESTLCDDLLGMNEEGIVLADGEITEGRIYGDSLVNKWIKGKYSITPSIGFVECEGFKPNTLYTIRLYDVVSVTETAVYDGTQMTALANYSRNKIYTFTTISDKIKLYSRNSEVYQSVNVLILEGDWTETINTIEHFDGIGSVANPCTIFLNNNFTDKNLFNKDTVTVGYTLNTSTGEPSRVNSSYSTSDFIFVAEGYNYRVANDNCSEMCFYDLNKNFISSISRSFTPTQNGYIRFVYSNSNINRVMFGSFSSTNPTYTEYQQLDMQQATFPYTLNKLPNGVVDYIDVVNKVHVQRVEEIDLSQVNWIPAQHNNSNYIGGYSSSVNSGTYNKKFKRTSIVLSGMEELKGGYTESLQDLAIRLHSDDSAFLLYTIKKQKLLDAGIISSLDEYVNSPKLQSYFATLTNVKVYGELATPIYTPLTDEDIAQLPLSAYKDGYVMLSSDQLTPSFEFRMRASNRYQVDMLETGYYYLNAPVGNVKLGTANVDVQQMPCIVKVDNVGTGDSGYRLGFDNPYGCYLDLKEENVVLNYYLDNNGLPVSSMRDAYYAEYIPVNANCEVYIEQTSLRTSYSIGVNFYDENKTNISKINNYDKKIVKISNFPNNAKYVRISTQYNESNPNDTNVCRIIVNPITLAKLPSHRIPKSFTQGMRCATDFGYWEGIKESNAISFRTVNTSSGWSIVESISIKDGIGVTLNRIEYGNTIVEDEFDIATGKLIKRIGIMTLDGSENWKQINDKNTEDDKYVYKYQLRFNDMVKPNFKPSKGVISNRHPYQSSIWDFDKEGVSIGGSDIVLALYREKAHSLEVLKQYLATSPLTIYYELAVPEISYPNISSPQAKTVANTALQCAHHNGYLNPQVKPSHLTYPVPSLVGNREYTVVHNRKNINGSTKPITLDLGGTQVELNDASSKTLVKTPSSLKHSSLIFTGGESTVDHIMVLDGDWTNKPIEYFENMKGHDTDAIITITGDGKIDDVAEQYLW